MSIIADLVSNAIEPTYNLSLILAVVWVIKNDYAKYTTSSVTIAQYASSEASRWYHFDLIEDIMKRATNHKKETDIKYIMEFENLNENGGKREADAKSDPDDFRRTLTDDELFYRTFENKDKAIWFVNSLEAFERLEADLLNPRIHYDRNGFFCLIYTGSEENRLENIKTIFRRLFLIYVTNINVFLMVGRFPYVYTYFPFNKRLCHSSQPSLYLSFRGIRENEKFPMDKPFFPSKVANMYGCELVIVTWQQSPFIEFERENNTGRITRIHGIEGLLMIILAEKMNFSMQIMEPEVKERGNVYDNGTATGATKLLLDGLGNITIVSYMYDKRRSEYLLASYTYTTIPLVVAIPIGLPMTPFERLIRPFKYIIWSCLSTSILVGILVIFFLKLVGKSSTIRFVFGAHNRIPFTNLWSTLYGVAVHGKLPGRNFARYLLTVWLLYTLVLRAAYSGELYILLQDGRARTTLQTLNELVRKNFTFYTVRTLEKTLAETVVGANIQYYDHYNNTTHKLIFQLYDENSKLAITIPDFSLRALNRKKSHRTRPIKILPEKLFSMPITFYMRKHSYLEHSINGHLLQLMAAGIVRKCEELYVGSEDTYRDSHEPTVLSPWLLLGIFSVTIVLMLSCVVVFLFELLSSRSNVVRKIMDFLNC